MSEYLFVNYYWQLYDVVAQHQDIIANFNQIEDHLDVIFFERIRWDIEFIDGSKLVARIEIEISERKVLEKEYYYGYYDRNENRLFSYDNTPHHEWISTAPHHMHRGQIAGLDKAYPTDIRPVTLANVLAKIRKFLGVDAVYD